VQRKIIFEFVLNFCCLLMLFFVSFRLQTYEKIQITKFDQVDDVRTDVAALDKTSKPNTANGASSHVTLRSSLRRASFTMPSGLVPITPQTPGVGGLSPYPGVTPAGGAHQPATSIAAVLPASAFSFDEEIYAALLRFYSDLLSGYKKFLFFISDVPFFNAQGFLTQRVAREPTSLEFYKAFVSSRSFDVFIEEESQPDVYHEYFGAASEFSVGANRIQTILAQDFGATERILVMPYPGHHHEGELLSDGGRVEVGVTQLGSDDVIQAVVLDPPTASHTAAATTSTPFSTPFTLTDPASAHRALHWVGMEQDLPHYKSASTQLVPRKPKQLSSAASMTESHGSSFGLGENLSPHAGNSTGFATASNQADASKTSQSTLPAGSASAPTSSDKSKQQARSKKGPHVEASGEHRIKLMLSEIFSSQTLKKEELKDFTQLLQEPQMRRVFATILSQPKQGGSTSGSGGSGSTPSSSQGTSASLCLTQAGFDQLSSLVKALLDACLPSKDYASASAGALDVGNVYFREETKTHVRTYLESTLRRHPIWQSLEFWRANLGLALSHRALKAEKAHSHSLPTSPTGDEEWVLQWMISAAHSMMSNNVPPAKVEELMMDVCASHHLKPETRETIMSFLAKIKEAAQYW
jgi:hypothetical protein